MFKLKNMNLSKMPKKVTLTPDSLVDKSLDDVKNLNSKNFENVNLNEVNFDPIIIPGDLKPDILVNRNLEDIKLDEEQKKVR